MPPQETPAPRPVRDLADAYVTDLAGLDPLLATMLGVHPGVSGLPDLSPAGQEARDGLARSTLARLGALLPLAAGAPADADERRCARLLRERLETGLAVSETGEHLRSVRNILGPVQAVRTGVQLMPARSEEDWSAVARRMAAVPSALAGYTASLDEGARRGLLAAPRQVRALTGQLAEWAAAGGGRGWFSGFAEPAAAGRALRADLDAAAAAADAAVEGLRAWLATDYLPRAGGAPDAAGRDRYQVLARQWTGADLDLAEAYDWGWSEYRRLATAMRDQASRVLPGATVPEAMAHLDAHGEAVTGVAAVRDRLQRMIDDAMAALDGTHFDIADPVKVLQARIAPPGSAAAPYYTRPSQDFSRPGRTWLPTLGQTRFPLWKLVSTWYHEGVPGHHLQLAHWVTLSGRLSVFQTGVGNVSATTEGWALYAERLMDELGFLADPGARLGYLEAEMRRAIRVITDIGMHLELPLPPDSPLAPGATWTPDLAEAFFAAHTARSPEFVASEITRYLGVPGQAISYKVGQRAWLAGREAARAAHGGAFDLKAWHTAALALGSLGARDLTAELAAATPSPSRPGRRP